MTATSPPTRYSDDNLGPYAIGANLYWNAGWRGVLPLPPKAKKNPPAGTTGEGGVDPSYPDVYGWTEAREGGGNIALRLPLDVIGVDVDAYDDKPGAATLTAAERAHGELPPTWRTTSRDDGTSGIRLYRVPPGLAWDQIGPGIETIQRGHRYAVVWPSIHPEGGRYRWIGPDGVVSTVVPHVDDLPSLPERWVQAYSKGEATATPRNTYTTDHAAVWLTGVAGAAATPCRRMQSAVDTDVAALTRGDGSAHDLACQATARLVRLAAEGHPGVLLGLAAAHQAFAANVTSPRRPGSTRTAREAEAEWRDLIHSAVNLVSADMPAAPSCDCDGQLTALIVPDRPAERPADRPGPAPAGAATERPDRPTVPLDAPADPSTAPDPQREQQPATATSTTASAAEPAVERTSWWPRDLEPVLSGEQVEPPPTVLERDDGQALWYPGKINGLIGESESGKTWVALLGVAQLLRESHRVLYLDFEDAAPGIVSRLKALGLSGAQIRAGLDYADPSESLHMAASGDLAELLEARSYALIVVDGFNAAMTLLGLDLMSNTDVTKFFQLLLRPLAKTGSAVAYVDHIGKSAATDADSKGGIGAQAKRAMTTGCVIKVKVGDPFGRGMTGRLHLVVDKDRAGHVRGASGSGKDAGTAVLESNRESGAVAVAITNPDRTTPREKADGKRLMLMEQISDWLLTQPESTSKRALRAAVPGRNDDVDAAMRDLVKAGYVNARLVGGGLQHTLLRAYSVADSLVSETAIEGPETSTVPTVPDRAPTVPGAQDQDRRETVPPCPISIDGARARPTEVGGGRTADECEACPAPEAGSAEVVEPSVEPSVEPPVDDRAGELDCNRCGRAFPTKVIETFAGYCPSCSREEGRSR